MTFHPVNPSTMPTPGALVLLVYADTCGMSATGNVRISNETKANNACGSLLLCGESFGYALAVLIVDKDGFNRQYPKHFQHAFLSEPPLYGRRDHERVTVVLSHVIPISAVAQWAYVNVHHEKATSDEGLELT